MRGSGMFPPPKESKDQKELADKTVDRIWSKREKKMCKDCNLEMHTFTKFQSIDNGKYRDVPMCPSCGSRE